MKKAIIEEIKQGDTGQLSRNKLNNNFGRLNGVISELDSVISELDSEVSEIHSVNNKLTDKINNLSNTLVSELKLQPSVENYNELWGDFSLAEDGWASLVKNDPNPIDYPNGQIYVWRNWATDWLPTGLIGLPKDTVTNSSLTQTLGTATDKAPSEKAVAEAFRSSTLLASESANGLMSAEQVKQLNEITEYMKPIEERYDSFFHIKLKNEEPKTVYSAFLFASKGKNAELEVDGVRALIDTSEWGNSLSATVGIKGDLKLWYTGGMLMKLFYLINDADTIRCVSRSPYLVEIDIDHVKARFADFSGVRYLQKVKASDTNINTLDLGNNSSIKSVYVFNNHSLTTLVVGGAVVNNIDVSYCAQLTGISFNVDSLPALESLNLNNTAITRKSLMKIENVWASRVGKSAGVLTLNEALFNELSTAEKSLFINKNITFNIA